MTMTIGMRELARNSNVLDGYDYVEVEDKKTHEYKGLFISPKYADEFKAYLDEKIATNLEKQLDEFWKRCGMEKVNKRGQVLGISSF